MKEKYYHIEGYDNIIPDQIKMHDEYSFGIQLVRINIYFLLCLESTI